MSGAGLSSMWSLKRTPVDTSPRPVPSEVGGDLPQNGLGGGAPDRGSARWACELDAHSANGLGPESAISR